MERNIKKALVVDPDPATAEMLREYLDIYPFQTRFARTAETALKLLEQESFDLILSELILEHCDSGFMLAYEVKKRFPAIPFFIITSLSRKSGMVFSMNDDGAKEWIHADVILNKDIRFEQLDREIRFRLKFNKQY